MMDNIKGQNVSRPKRKKVQVSKSGDRHGVYFSHEDDHHVDIRSINRSTRSFSPTPPCPGNMDESWVENTVPSQVSRKTLDHVIQEDLPPGLYVKMADMMEKKLEPVIAAIKDLKQPCLRCSTQNNDEQSGLSTGTENTTIAYLNTNPSGEDRSLHQPVQTKSGYLVKYGSEIHLVTSQTFAQSTANTLEPSSTVPVVQHRTRPISAPISRLSSRRSMIGKYRDKTDERECLAKALQMNVMELVNDVIFKDSELPDSLLADGCLTENESLRCRTFQDPRDQVRLLLSIIKGRDLDVLIRFLRHIRRHNESVATKIVETFEQNKKAGMRANACALCKLASRVDVKYIADILYKNDLVDDGLYNTMFQTNQPTGSQGEIWHKVIANLNIKCAESAESKKNVKKTLEEALVHKNHYNQLAKDLQRMIISQNEISCHCTIRYIHPFRGSDMSSVSSSYPHTSTSDGRETSYDMSDIVKSEEESTTQNSHSGHTLQHKSAGNFDLTMHRKPRTLALLHDMEASDV